MYPEALVFGIVDRPSPQGEAALASKLRDLTISWSRYDYRGRVLVGETIDGVLDQALELGYRWCLVQRAGNIILERWQADEDRRRFDQSVSRWIGERDFLALAAAGDDCLLVDVPRWEKLGRPDIRRPLVDDPGESTQEHCLSLARLSPEEGSRLARYLGDGIRSFSEEEASLDPRIGVFLQEVQQQVLNAPRGVFLWNLEPYDDVQTPPTGFDPPISTLYSVASGFKPNMILESLGFDARTRVVFFDCSTRALEVKRLLLEGWDGRDFPAFVPHLFHKVPSGDAHYHLWDGATPETLDPKAVERAWERELERWGGERAFAKHWSRYRQLRHEFVHCDVLDGAAPLLARVEPEENAVIWWSNAFFSVWGNWLLDAAERRAAYERWIEELAERNPDLFLYGSDFSNSSVNDVKAGEYRLMLRDADCDELVPLSVNTHEIRF
jgi:hypothetical protein